MRLLILAGALALVGGAALAQPAPAGGLPKAFQDYAQPDITPGLCKNVSVKETDCVIPQMTAGRYLIEVSGTSTATAADAQQGIQIQVGGTICGAGTAHNTRPLSTTGPTTIKLDCEAIILTDKTLTVRAVYDDLKATKDPKGPTLSIRRLPWEGLLNSRVFAPQ
jgi:hypothetical protein